MSSELSPLMAERCRSLARSWRQLLTQTTDTLVVIHNSVHSLPSRRSSSMVAAFQPSAGLISFGPPQLGKRGQPRSFFPFRIVRFTSSLRHRGHSNGPSPTHGRYVDRSDSRQIASDSNTQNSLNACILRVSMMGTGLLAAEEVCRATTSNSSQSDTSRGSRDAQQNRDWRHVPAERQLPRYSRGSTGQCREQLLRSGVAWQASCVRARQRGWEWQPGPTLHQSNFGADFCQNPCLWRWETADEREQESNRRKTERCKTPSFLSCGRV